MLTVIRNKVLRWHITLLLPSGFGKRERGGARGKSSHILGHIIVRWSAPESSGNYPVPILTDYINLCGVVVRKHTPVAVDDSTSTTALACTII